MDYHSDEKTIRRYLLGDLAEGERQEVERQMMIDGEFTEQVTLLEEELVDAYVCGTLPLFEREKFERYFLATPEGVQQVKLATLLHRYASSRTATRKQAARESDSSAVRRSIQDYLRARMPVPGYAVALIVVLFVLIGVGLLASIWRLQSQVEGLRAQQSQSYQDLQEQLSEQQARNQELREQLKHEQDQRAALEQELNAQKTSKEPDPLQKKMLAIVLSPIRVRSEGATTRLVIEPGTESVLFHLLLRSSDYGVYKVSLQTETGQELWTRDGVKAEARNGRPEVRVNLPAKRLASGNYFLKLQGATSQGTYEAVGNYFFQVVTR